MFKLLLNFSGPYFSVFGENTGKYGPEKNLYSDTFHTVKSIKSVNLSTNESIKKSTLFPHKLL